MAEVTLAINLTGPEPRNPVPIFHLDQAFFLAGNRCLLNIDVGPGITRCLVSPGVVNLCLAIELFLKSVIVANGAAAPKLHKLQGPMLPRSPRFPSSASCIVQRSSLPAPAFDELLEQINEYFVKLRYGYEFNIFAFHEHPVYVLANLLYVRSAHVHGQQTGIEASTLDRLKEFRDTIGAHSDSKATIRSLPSHAEFEILFSFAKSFYGLVSRSINNVGPALVPREVGRDFVRLIESLGVQAAKFDFDEEK